MKIKVCGLNDPSSMMELSNLDVDFLGFIFYKGSPRYCDLLKKDHLEVLTVKQKKVGVFVNASEQEIDAAIEQYALDLVQLHGEETPTLCASIQKKIPVIKAISVAQQLNMEQLKGFAETCDYFLFDTKTNVHGGSGKKFDWRLLENYDLPIPFFLSGGIGLEDLESIKKLSHPQLYGIDINSKFELSPGKKDTALVKEFIHQLKSKYENRNKI